LDKHAQKQVGKISMKGTAGVEKHQMTADTLLFGYAQVPIAWALSFQPTHQRARKCSWSYRANGIWNAGFVSRDL